jgi:hypothetical protein
MAMRAQRAPNRRWTEEEFYAARDAARPGERWEYWIVDDMSQTVERWTPDDDRPELLAEQLLWQPEGAAEPFVLDIVQFFKDVAADD